MFQSLYDSPWTTTALVAVPAFFVLAIWLRRRSFLVAFLALFTIEILADALRSGSWSPILTFFPAADPYVSAVFVLVGDFRYFLLVERFAQKPDIRPLDATTGRGWGAAVLFTCIVPAVMRIVSWVDPSPAWEARPGYLLYEGSFLVLAIALRFAVLPKRLAKAPEAVRRWLLELTVFEIVQYALWASADVIILLGADVGFLLRIVPNVLYFVLFLAVVAFRAPKEVDA